MLCPASSSDVPLTTRLEYSRHWVCLRHNTTAVTTIILLGIESLAVVADFFTTFLVGTCPDILELPAVVVRFCDLDAKMLEGYLAFSAPFHEASSVRTRIPADQVVCNMDKVKRMREDGFTFERWK